MACTAGTVDVTEGNEARDHDSEMMISVESVFVDRTRFWCSENWEFCCAHRSV